MLQKSIKNTHFSFCSSLKQFQSALSKHYKNNPPVLGHCTHKSSHLFSQSAPDVNPSHWRSPSHIGQQLKLSSLGLGTQYGSPDQQSDLKMFTVLYEAIKSGKINCIDTDVNFRYGKSEKTINAVLNYLKQQNKVSRESLFISTKCGYLFHDVDSGLNEDGLKKMLVQDKIVKPEDIVNQLHCLEPNFLGFSLQKSLISLGLETIDLLYLNNPTQFQQNAMTKQKYHQKLHKAFETMQYFRSLNKIRYYGMASFVSFRSPPEDEGVHAQLHQIVKIAQKVGGNSHGFKFLLVPFNLGMPEVLADWQNSSDKEKGKVNLLSVAQQAKINVNFCCPLFQGRVAALPFQSQILNNISGNSGKHLQVARSVPYSSNLTTIFGSLNTQHVKQNLEISKVPTLTRQQWKSILRIP